MLPLAILVSLSLDAIDERPLPSIPLVEFTGTEASALDDFLGQVLLLDFFANWCAPCARLVPHVNELREDFGEHGLAVLGVTSDTVEIAHAWLERFGGHYPFARDPELHLQVELGFRPLPCAVLVDAFGVLVWQGRPDELPLERLELLLEDALPLPAHRWPVSAGSVRKALREARWSEALSLAAELPPEAPRLVPYVRRSIARRFELLDAALAVPDPLMVEELAISLESGLAPGPERERAVRAHEQLAALPGSGEILAAQRQLATLWTRVSTLESAQQADQLAGEISALGARYPESALARRTKTHLETLTAFRALLK